jgi:hypothetical protein
MIAKCRRPDKVPAGARDVATQPMVVARPGRSRPGAHRHWQTCPFWVM